MKKEERKSNIIILLLFISIILIVLDIIYTNSNYNKCVNKNSNNTAICEQLKK